MDEKQKLESIKRDLLASGANLRNKMLSEYVLLCQRHVSAAPLTDAPHPDLVQGHE